MISELPRENEPVSTLRNPACSARPEEVVSDAVSVLENEVCSSGLEDVVSDPVSILTNEKRSARAEEIPDEPERLLTKLLVSEPASDNELVRALNREI